MRLLHGEFKGAPHTYTIGVMFTQDDLERYSRQILLPKVGGRGQARLGQIRVAIVGAGGLGSPAAIYLAAGGVGGLTLIDSDRVDRSNLHRQVVHAEGDVGRWKVESGADRVRALNPSVEVKAVRERLDEKNCRQILSGHDVVIEGSDNLETKFIVNDACYFERIPLVWGGILRFEGQVSMVLPGESACYRCLFREPPPPGTAPTCQQAGVLGPLAGVVGTLQAAEVIKWGIGIGEPLTNRILSIDLLSGRMREVPIPRSRGCPLCGESPRIETVGAGRETA